MRHFVELKNSLFPYLYAASYDAKDYGWPVMRGMMVEFPEDPGCKHLDRQFMLGGSLLVAAIFRQDNVAVRRSQRPHGRGGSHRWVARCSSSASA